LRQCIGVNYLFEGGAATAAAAAQKWMIKSLAAMTAQFLDGGIPALALPLNAFAFSER
jgi:hypothetical protein